MRKIILLILLKLSIQGVLAQTNNNGFYETYIIINNVYYDLGANTGNPNLQGNNLGTYSCANTLVLNGFQAKIFKCNSCDVTNVKLNYRVYKNGSSPGSFSSINFSSANNISGAGAGCQNQQWEKTGGSVNLITGLSDGIYTVEIYTDGQGTNCINSNFYDTNLNGDINYTATFTINNPITVTNQPTSPIVCFGGNTTLNAAATGIDAYIWQKQSGANWVNVGNGSVANGASTSLSLTNVTTTEVYRCLFTNCGGINTLASNAITVTPQRPTITVQPRSQTDCINNDIIYDITATGTAAMSYQWEKKLVGGGFNSVTSDANITNPSINSLKVSNIGNTSNPNLTEYRCIVTDGNSCSVTSDAAVMTVNSIQGTLASQSVCEGANVSYSINTIGSVLTFQWQKRIGLGGVWSDILTNGGGKYSGFNSNTLSIIGATNAADNDTYYQCIVTFAITSGNNNGAGATSCPRTSDNARLVVVAYPPIPIHTNAIEKGCVNLANSLNSTGCSPNVTTWYDSENNVLGTGANFSVTKNSPGTYKYFSTCTQTLSGCVSPKSTGVTFNVSDLPTISLGIVPDICNNLTTFSLPFTTTGSPNRYSISASTPALSGLVALPNTTTLGSSPISVTIPANTLPNTYQFVVTARSTTTTCISNPQNFTVKINDTPTAPIATSPINYCQNSSTTALSASAVGSNVLRWYGTSATGGTASLSASIPGSASTGTINYYVSQISSDNCESSRTGIAVIVNTIPTSPLTSNSLNYCKNSTALALDATASGTNTLVWYDADDNILYTAPIPNTNTVGTQTFKVSQKSPAPANCESPKATITITVLDNPEAPTVTTPLGYCQNSTASALAATPAGSNTLLWYNNNAIGGNSSGTAPTPSTTLTGISSFYVSQKDANNCESPRAKIDVEITPTLSASITGINGICLTGALNNTTTLTANPVGGNGSYSYQWQNLAGNIALASNQTYQVTNSFQTGISDTYKTIITSGFCITTATLTVTKQGWNDIPNVAGNTPDICVSGSKTLTIVSPNASGTYKWFDDLTSLSQISSGISYITPSLSAIKTYYVAREQAITGSLTCQTERRAVPINVISTPPAPTIINSADKTSFCNSESSFTLSVSCNAGIAQYRLNNGSWTSGNAVTINPINYPSLVTFNYDFKCVVNATCESSVTSSSFTVSPAPTAPSVFGNTSLCTGGSTTLTASNCLGAVIWSNGETANSINISSSGTYSAICNLNSCLSIASSTKTVVVNPIPNPPIIILDDTDNIVCEGVNVLLTASNCSGTVIWSNGVTASSISVSSSGTYSAICSANGCLSLVSSIQTILVNAIPNPPTIISDDADNIVCEGTKVLLSASNCLGKVNWSTGETANSINVSSSGTYSATCTINSCQSDASATQTILVNSIPNQPTVISDDADNLVCEGTNVLLIASNYLGTIIWSNGETASSINVSSSGTYYAICSVNSCISSQSSLQIITVKSIPPTPSISGNTSFCSGNSTLLTANGCSGIVKWNTGATGSTLNVSTAGEFSATCTENFCISAVSSPFTVSENLLPSFILNPIHGICNSASTFDLTYNASANNLIKYNLTSTMPDYNAINETSLPTSSIIVAIPHGKTGTHSFTLNLKNSSTGCLKSETFNVSVLPILTGGSIEASPKSINCAGYNPGNITSIAFASGGKPTYIYQWQKSTDNVSFSDISGANLTTYDPAGISQTTYFRRKTTDVCGDEVFSTNTHTIALVPDPVVSISSDKTNICSGEKINFSLNINESGSGTCSTVWKSSHSVSMTSPTAENTGSGFLLSLTNSGTTAIKKYIQATYSCSTSSCNNAISNVVEITVNPSPNALTVSGGGTICRGTNTTLTTSACNGSLLWSNGETTSSINVSSAGTYTASCTNSCGTSATSNGVIVNLTTINPPILSGETSICSGQTAILTGSGCNGTIVWSNNSSGTSISVIPDITTSYTATCIENSCASTQSLGVTVTVSSSIDFSISSVPDLCNSATSFSLVYNVRLGSPDRYSLTSDMPSFTTINDVDLGISPVFVNIPSGKTGAHSFTLSLKNSSTGCLKSETFNVSILPILTGGIIETSPKSINCAGYNPGNITSIAFASGGKPTYNYQWQSSTDGSIFNDLTVDKDVSYDPPALNQTTYFRRKVTDACGEEVFSSNVHHLSIVPDPAILITNTDDKIICSGGSFTLEATFSGGFGTCTSNWQSSDLPSSGFVTEQSGGVFFTKTFLNNNSSPIIKYFKVIYACSGTGSGSCNQATSKVVKVIINNIVNLPVITPSSVVICPTQSTTLTASGCAGIVTWNNGQTGNLLTVDAAGTYSATCSINNCISAESLSAVVLAASGGSLVTPPSINGTASICIGQSTSLTASGCTGKVRWSDGSTGMSISVNPAMSTNYTATCNDGTCTSGISNQVTVNVNNYPVISKQPKSEEDCHGNSVTFSVNLNPATSYQWQRKTPNGNFVDILNATKNLLTINNIGNETDSNQTQYQVIVSNATCSVTSTVAILTVNAITGHIADQTVCEGANIIFNLTNISTTGTIQSYQWQKRIGSSGTWNDIAGANNTIFSINNATNADEQYYRCRINFLVGNSICSRYTTEEDPIGAKLTILAASTPSISGNNVICLGKTTTLTANNCDGIIIWSSGQSTSIITVSPSISTSYTVTCTTSQCNFAITSNPYRIDVNSTPQPINITSDVITPSTLIFSASPNVTNGILKWYNKATGGTGTTISPVFTKVGNYSYWLTQTDTLTGCESTRLPVIAKVLDYFHLIAQPSTQADCKGNSVYMNVTAVASNNSYAYQWQRKRPDEADFSNLTADENGIKGWYAKTMVVSNIGNEYNPNQTQYRCIVSNGTESLTSDIATLSVNSVIGALPNIGTCVGSDININLPNYFSITGNVKSYQWQTRTGTSGTWSDLSDANGISGSQSNDLKFNNIAYNQGVFYRCLVKFNTQGFECIEPTDAGQLIVSGFPPAPLVANIFYCQFSNSVKLKVKGPTQNQVWYTQANGGEGSLIAPIPNTNVAGTFAYYVADRTDQGCEGTRSEVKVEIGAMPPAPINTTPNIITEGTTLTFSADGSPKEGQILKWYNSPTGTVFTTIAPTFTAVGNYTKYVAQLSAFGCQGPRALITASIIPNLKFTKQPIAQADCNGNSVTFSVSATGSGAFTYQWQKLKPDDTTFVNILNETANVLKISNVGDANNPNLTKYRCIIKDEKGLVISQEVPLIVNEIKGNLANMALCDGKTTKLSFNKLSITGNVIVYQWQKKEGNSYINIQTDSDGFSIVNEVGTYRGKVTFFVDNKTSCSRNTDDLKIEIKPVPPAPQVSNQAICQDIMFNLEKSVKASNPLLWYASITDTTGEKTAPKIDLNKIGKNTFYVSQLTQFGCESERKSFDLTIAPTPIKPALDDISFCRNMPNATLPFLTDQENQYVWYASLSSKVPFSKTPIVNTKTDGAVTYFVSNKNLAGCESEKIPLKISIAPCIATFEGNYNNCLQVSADSVIGNKWYDLYDNKGNLYASVNPNGLNLGKVTVSIRHYGRGSDAIPSTQNETRLMARYFDFQSSLLEDFEKSVSLRIYYLNDELSEYRTAINLPNLTINDFNIVHYDGISEDCGFENNDNFIEGNSVVIYKNVKGSQIAKNFFYLQFDVNEFSENGATANDFTELTMIAKETNEQSIKINWQSKFEIKENKYILERSADCKKWAALGLIDANGTNSSYEKIDYQPLGGRSCYRLVYIDKDGTKKYLDPVEIELFDTTAICSVFPNPWMIGDEVNLYLRNIKEKEIKLLDLIGQQYSFNWKKDDLGIIHIRPDTYLNKGLHFVLVIGEDGKRCLQKIVINP